MALENDDLIVVQKNGGGELRKAKISDIKPDLPPELWTEDSGKLYPTTLTNNVGIGTSSPNFLLHLDGGHMHRFREATGTSATPHEDALVTYGSATAPFGGMYGINHYSTDTRTDLAFKVTNNTGSIYEALRIRYDGNVGIGTDSPAVGLEVSGTTANSSRLRVTRSSVSGELGILNNDTFIAPLGSDGSNGSLLFYSGGGERARILANGNVGIGTDSPERELHVKGSSNAIRVETTGTAARIEFENQSSSASDAVAIGSVSDDMQLIAGGAERARILANGNCGIGTDSPSAKLHVKEATSYSNITAASATVLLNSQEGTYTVGNYVNNLIWSRPSSNGGTASAFIGLRCIDNSGANGALAFGASSSSTIDERMCILPSGNVGIGTDSPDSKLHVNGKIRSNSTEAGDPATTVVTKDYVGNGALTIQTAGEGASATGTFTANQTGGSTLTLPTIRYGDLSGTPTIPAAANNGQININGGDGITASGANATADQSGNTTRTLAVDNTVIRTTGNQSMAGVKTFTGTIGTNSSTVFQLENLPALP